MTIVSLCRQKDALTEIVLMAGARPS